MVVLDPTGKEHRSSSPMAKPPPKKKVTKPKKEERKEWGKKEFKEKFEEVPTNEIIKREMKELEKNLREDLSDLSDNAPTQDKTPKAQGNVKQLDNDRLEFERMLDCM